MNKKCTINLQDDDAIKYRHHFTYRLLFYIMKQYDKDCKRIFIDKDEVIKECNTNHVSLNNAIRELINKGIIIKYNEYKNCYKINNKFFIGF